MTITDAKKIRRKSEVPESDRTAGKDAAAEFIEEEVLEKGRWPMHLTEIADLSEEKLGDDGWSRQHITNTINDYFEPVYDGGAGSNSQRVGDGERLELDIVIPEDVESRRDYVRGYVDGLLSQQR